MTFVFTSDVDFVSDDVLKRAYLPFESLPLTVFMTGKSEFLNSAEKNKKKWELQIHPNFCNGSTHGKTIDKVFETINNFKGRGNGFRCHRYFSSNDVVEKFAQLGYVYSSNVCTDLELVSPFLDRCGMVQFPIFMEDGGYLKYHGVPMIKEIIAKMKKDGIYVFNFHPIHLALNSCDFSAVRGLKDSLTATEYSAMTGDDMEKYRNNGYGMMDFLMELIEYADKNKIRFMNLGECYEEYKAVRF